MNELISVIVPVHNSGEYLVSCIESIIYQSYENLEIILVDDGSTDESVVICDSYAAMDNRIRVIHKKSEGGAKARNIGIELASGEIFAFMDSDDYIDEKMLSKMYSLMCEENSDCVISSFHYIDKSQHELNWRTPKLAAYRAMSGKDTARLFLTTFDIEGFSWNKLFRRKIIMEYGIRFDETMNSFVDIYGMFRAILNCKKISFCNEQFYYYRQHDVSCVHTIDKRKLENFKRVLGQIEQLAKENGLMIESEHYYAYRLILQLYDAIKNKNNYSIIEWEEVKRDFKWNNIFYKNILEVAKVCFLYIKKNRIKAAIKLLLVWYNFK